MDSNNEILLRLLSSNKEGKIDDKQAETISMYRECSKLIEKTYLALGKNRSLKITTQSTINGRINTRTISTTSKI